jgi:hypothetical protein
MNAKKFFSVVTAFLLAVGLSTVAIAGPAAAVVVGDDGGGGSGTTTSTPTPSPTPTSEPEDGTEGGDGGEGGEGGEGHTVKDATASVTVTPASCSAPAKLVYGSYTHSSVQSGSTADGTQGPSSGSGTTHFKVTFVSDSGHKFSDDSATKSFEGDLAAKKSGAECTPPAPKCIPTNKVSYTYSYTTNSGTITVPDVEGSTHLLCDDFYVTATSWKFVKVGNTWPQMLDVTDKLGPISAPGSYDFAAAVTCGQGDIYASYTSQPTPTSVLNGPSDPFAEHFLHQMGFSGPNPTYFQQSRDCISVSPTVSYTLGECYADGDFSAKNLTIIFDNSASTVPVIFTVPEAVDVNGTGTKPIVRTVAAGAVVNVETTPVWTTGVTYAVTFTGVYTVVIPDSSVVIGEFDGCAQVTPGDPSHTNETCDGNVNVAGSITVGLETGLTYSIDGPGTAHDISPVTQATTTGLPAGDYVVSVVAQAGYVLSGADTWPFTITIKSIDCGELPTKTLVTPTASSVDRTCFAEGSYTLDNIKGVLWTINDLPVAPGTYYVNSAQTVVAKANPDAPDYGFEDGFAVPTVFTFVFTTPEGCELPTDALVTPTASSVNITCSAAGSYTLDAITGVIWSIGNTTIPAGKYTVATSQTVVASAKPDAPTYGFDNGVSNPSIFTFVFAAPSQAECDQLKTLAFTGGSTNGMLFAGGLALIAVGGILIVSRRAVRRQQ